MNHNLKNIHKKHVAIIGAGAAGLMAAEVLSAHQVQVSVFDHKATAARKILMAGKTGLNISHAEALEVFLTRYTPSDWLADYVRAFDATKIRAWMDALGIESYIGSTGRIFPKQMKASTLVRAWLKRLDSRGVQFFYRHRCCHIQDKQITLEKLDNKNSVIERIEQSFDAVILACGGGSYAALGSDGNWQSWFDAAHLTPLYPSNVGVLCTWSKYMTAFFGQALKRVEAWVGDDSTAKNQARYSGDIVISHYGLESGLIYRLNAQMRDAMSVSPTNTCWAYLDLLPVKEIASIKQFFIKNKKQSLNTQLKKLGLDAVKIALLRECTNKTDWSDYDKMAVAIKSLPVHCLGFRPIDEAISTGGGVKRDVLDADLQLRGHSGVFCAGEMLDWDAPTGGYLLTACFATGRAAAFGVVKYLSLA